LVESYQEASDLEQAFLETKKNHPASTLDMSFLEEEIVINPENQNDQPLSITPVSTPKIIPIWRRYLKPLSIAASLLLVFTTYQWSHINYSNDSLMKDYNISTDRGVKSSTTPTVSSKIERLLKNGQYNQAVQAAEQQLNSAISVDEKIAINESLATTFKNQKNYSKAIIYLENLEKLTSEETKFNQQLNIILLHVLNENKTKALDKIKTVRIANGANLGKDDLDKLSKIERKITHPLRFLVE